MNVTGRVNVPLTFGANFQFPRTQRAAALESIGGPEAAETSVIFPFETVIVTFTSPVMCICNACGG
jgi:hypothetical protein